MEVARDVWRRQVCCDYWRPAHRDGRSEVFGWLLRSCWVEALVQVEITTAGTADSFLREAHVARTRRADQVIAVAMYIIQYRVCNSTDTDAENEPLGLE